MTSHCRGAALFVAAVALGTLAAPLAAQESGTIGGTVRESGSNRPIPAVQVFIPETSFGAVTDEKGEFRILGVPAGPHSLRARMIGYSQLEHRVNVTAGQTATVDFALTRSALTLEQIVVTGTGIATEKRKLGNTIATITSEALENKPIITLSEALSGREPGVAVLPASGLTGEGSIIRIRGTSSLSQSNEPIVYLNGIRVDNGGGRGNIGTGGGGLPSRLDDIDPNSIERMEILKGAAAATLYGSEASAGVIQIFTKKGVAGPTRWTLDIEQGMLQYPDGAFEPNAGFVTTDTAAQRLSQWWGTSIAPYRVFERDFVSDLFETGYSSAYAGSVSGGTSGISYFASGRYQYEDGAIGAEDMARGKDRATRTQGTASLTMVPLEDLRLGLTTMYTESRSDIPGSNNNNIYAPITLAIFGQPQRASCVTPFGRSDPIAGTGRCSGVGNPRGQAAFATVREAFQRTIEQDTRHFNGSMTARYTATPEVGLDATFGIDIVRQRDEFFQGFGHNVDLYTTNNVEGARTVSDRNYRELSLDSKVSWNANFSSLINSQLVGGVQGFVRRIEITGGSGTAFPGPGFEVAEAGGVQDVDETFLSTVNAGFFVQEQVGWNDWIFGTVGARYDYSSAFGEAAGGVLYPKFSISIIPSDRAGWERQMLSTLRLRAAIGQSGQQPGAFDKLTTYGAIRSDTLGAGIAPDNLGNPDLKPEVATEWEVGSELGLFSDRVAVEFSYWDRTVKDALVQRQFPVTGGFFNRQLSNIGRLDAHGVEIGLRGAAYTGTAVQISLFANGAFLREEITSLGGAPPIKVGGSYPRYRNFIREGYAPGAFFGPILRRGTDLPIDINGDCQPDSRTDLLTYFAQPRTEASFAILLEGGDPRPCSTEKGHLLNYLGKPNPDWQGTFGADATVYRRFRVSTMFEYKAGDFWVHNLTDAFRRSHPSLGGNLRGSAEAKATLRNPGATAEERLDAALDWANNWAALTPYDGLHEVERADFVRWRELSLSYDVPERLVAGMGGARSMTLTLTGRNIALWTRYSGADPEINLLGRNAGTGSDFYTTAQAFATSLDAFGLPLARRYSFSVRVGF